MTHHFFPCQTFEMKDLDRVLIRLQGRKKQCKQIRVLQRFFNFCETTYAKFCAEQYDFCIKLRSRIFCVKVCIFMKGFQRN